MKEEAEAGVRQPQVKDPQGCRQPPEAGAEAWNGFSLGACRHLDFRLLASEP